MSSFVEKLQHEAGRDDGVLANQHLALALGEQFVVADDDIPAANIQPASLDLRLGDRAHQLRCSFLPGDATVEERLKELSLGEIGLDDGTVLAKGTSYLIPLRERLRLPRGIRARANPKSSTGRADVFTRVVTDNSFAFDDVRDGYSGSLYLEVVPLSFPVRVRTGLALNQLRLSVGQARLSDREVVDFHRTNRLLYRDRKPVRNEEVMVANGLMLGLNLKGDRRGQVGYRARAAAPVLDLTQRGVPIEPYWEPAMQQEGNRIILEPNRFYLLMSDEAVSIPPSLASEMTAYDPTSGELRTHYAGFFDPGFGYGRDGELRGSTAALEVRAHDIAFMIEHRQGVCKLTFEHMLSEPDTLYGSGIGSNYQGQTSTLGKHFKPADGPGDGPTSPPPPEPPPVPNLFDQGSTA